MGKSQDEVFESLQLLWSDFISDDESVDTKQQNLQLFLYNFQFLDENTLHADVGNSFLNSIPEEICSYLLERVYEIISKSHLFNLAVAHLDSDLLDIEEDQNGNNNECDSVQNCPLASGSNLERKVHNSPFKSKSIAKLLKDNHNFSQLILSAPSDCSKIVALRTFLTDQLGHHLLKFLIKTNIKLIASQKSLCNLCINLFPTCQWGDNNIQLQLPSSVFEFIGNLALYQRPKLSRSMDLSSVNCNRSAVIACTAILRGSSTAATSTAVEEDFQRFKSQTISSDEIASILIELLGKCVGNEREMTLNEQSMSVLCINFALDNLRVGHDTFGMENTEIIKCKLLELIEKSLNNIFVNEDNICAVKLNNILIRLTEALAANKEYLSREESSKTASLCRQILLGIMYLIFGILNNVVTINTRSNGNKTHDALKFINENTLNNCTLTWNELLRQQLDDESKALFTTMISVLTKIIDNLNRGNTCLTWPVGRAPRARSKKIRNPKLHCGQLHSACFFQKILLNVLNNLPHSLQEYVMRYLLRTGTCCCLYTVDSLRVFLGVATNDSIDFSLNLQKLSYKFVYRKVLSTIFIRTNSADSGNSSRSNACATCETLLKSMEFHEGVLQQYHATYTRISSLENAFYSYLMFLKHLKLISHLLTYDISSGILSKIVLPIFRTFKACNNAQCKEAERVKLLFECLNIFIIYLSDIRLIKAFYIEENMSHLEDLLHQPELSRSVCDLIKIGIDNGTFLGDNGQEQSTLSRRLIELQLRGGDKTAQWINTMLERLAKCSTAVREALWLDAQHNVNPTALHDLRPNQILHIATLHWALNYELLKTSQQFYNAISKMYAIDVESGEETQEIRKRSITGGNSCLMDIMKLSYNTLCCFLFFPKKSVNKLSNREHSLKAEFTSPYPQWPPAPPSPIPTINEGNHDNSLELLLTSLEQFSSSKYSINSSTSTTASSFVDVTELYMHGDSHLQESKHQNFLQKLQMRNCDDLIESVVLFDIRNQKKWQNDSTLARCHAFAVTALPPPIHDLHNAHETDQTQSIIGRLFNMFGLIFGSRSNSANDLNGSYSNDDKEQIDEELLSLCEPASECKKLLLKLFESTLAICIKGFHNAEVDKMEKHLRKLKSLILNSAATNWEHSEESMTAVTQALQTLLKIAELSQLANDGSTTLAANSTSTAEEPRRSISSYQHHPHLLHPLQLREYFIADSNDPNHQHHHRYGTQQRSMATANAACSGDSDADFFSTKASFHCHDSEVEFSENDTEDFYITADEGYEADGEIPEISEITEAETEELWNPFTPGSRYRTHIVHSGLCSLVVEILIELSKMCATNPSYWTANLAQLANRLFIIREQLGGPLFLLKGFAPVLQCNDIRLRELQQSILDLIVDLNTPDVLTEYLSILATKNPPVDILIKYMLYISSSTLKKAQPSVELEFPVVIDGKCISTSDTLITEHIERIRNYHLHCQANTSFTRAPCIIPITHTKLWSREGFTVSLWVQLKSAASHKSTSQLIEDDTRSSTDDYAKSHLISIGTNQAMLSIYINNNMNLVFETSKPNAEQQMRSPSDDSYETATATSPQFDVSNKLQPIMNQSRNSTPHGQIDKENVPTNVSASATAAQPPSSPLSTSPFKNALKQTKLVILNSFSNMHLFNGHGDADSYFEGSSIELKYFRLLKNKWTHLCFGVDFNQDRFNLTIFVDGLDQYLISLPFRNLRNLTKSSIFQIISIGDGVVVQKTSVVNCMESRSTIDGYPMRFSISNVLLFNVKFSSKECIQNLSAMGPDFIDLTQCQVGNWKPNYGYLNLNKSFKVKFGNFNQSMKILKDARVLSFSAQQPDLMMGYETSSDGENVPFGRSFGIILYGELTQNILKSLQITTVLCGGLSTLLYLFARVVELTCDSITQSMALDLLLTVALSESRLYTEFVRNDYLSLIGYVIKTERCSKDVHLLKSIVNNACTQPLISKKAESLQVNENTVSCVAYPRLIVSVIHRYSDWHRSAAEHSDVLDMLFRCTLALVRDKHPHKDFNMEQLNKAGLVKELLNLCKICVIESPNPVFISKQSAESFVSILGIFAGSPPSPSLMDEIMKLLLLLHKPSECFITHDRSKFYFLLKSQPPAKEKRSSSSMSRVAAPFRRNFFQDSANLRNNTSVAEKPSPRTTIRSNTLTLRTFRRTHANEFQENLESIADCSKINKNVLRLLSPVETSNWRTKFQRLVHGNQKCNSPRKHMSHCKATAQQKIIRKRIRLNSSRSDGGKKTRKVHISEDSAQSPTLITSDDDCHHLPNEVFHFNHKEPLAPPRRSKPTMVKTDFYNSEGIICLQEGLFILLKDFLWLLPDNSVEEVLKHYVKLEFLLVMANHSSTSVRTAIIKLLLALLKRLPANELVTFNKHFYSHHLANQLCIYPTDVHMFETCLEWVTGLYGNLDAFITYESIHIQNLFGLHALLSILTHTTSHSEFIAKAFNVLQIIYVTDPENNHNLIEFGLVQCCIKALYNIYTTETTMSTKTENAIIDLLTTVGEKSLKSVGQINIVWDILNIFSYYQVKDSMIVVKGFRSVQGKLQLNWLNMFFKRTNVPWSFKIIPLPDSNLTLSETKTRLDLLIDRCSQFFTVFGASYTPSQNEIKLFELLVSYGIATNSRCNNFIAWGLQPSRPHDLRAFIIDALWISCQDEFLPSIICDSKMIKSLLWLCLLEDLPAPIDNLGRLCHRLGINEHDSTWDLENQLQRLELNRHNTSTKQKAMLEKTIHKFEPLALGCIESSMITTRRVADSQVCWNAERKILMSHMKEYDENITFNQWLEIIRRMTHEGAPWYSKDRSESSWELDDTEGPSRVHTRLRRCHLDIDKRFIMEDYHPAATLRGDPYIRPLDYLISSYDQQLNISLNSQILYNFAAKYLPVDGEIDGEIIVTDHRLYFIATYRCKYFYVTCDINNITEIWLKRYQHQEKAFEIFLNTNQSLFFSLHHQDDWKIMKDMFLDKIVAQPDHNKVMLIAQQWREGLLTNWEYLMTLNQIAGRTYNDLMQYPVFPWILSNYTSESLDITEKSNFRKLNKPIAVQHEENEQHYINNYAYINNTMTTMGSLQLKPYHYSSHYSNSGTVLHFLVRVPPFTSYFLRYQDNNFDIPDRTFHALSTTWSLASRDSPTDVKELIPEFFSLPEMFENFERFNFGCRQSGERVEDVLLPPWCFRDPRLFVLIHRQALESEVVRNNLHHWIDLIFGHNQTGQNAIDAINVFHPATYSAFLDSKIQDPIERKAVETMVKTYGQMPRQLFRSAHPPSKALNYCLGDKEVLPNVHGLRWGIFLGSPQLPTPSLGNINKLPGADFLVSFHNTNVVYGLPAKSCVMQGADSDTYNVISWGYDDRVVRIQPISKANTKPKSLLYNSPVDSIAACGSDPNSNQLWCGHRSGRISIYKCSNIDSTNRHASKGRQSYVRGIKLSYNSAFRKITTKGNLKMDEDPEATSPLSSTSADGQLREGADLTWSGPTILVRHSDEITCICLSVEFKIAVSAGRDGIAVIWDLNNWTYIRTIERPAEIHHSPITLTAISPTLGDIVTVHSIPKTDYRGSALLSPTGQSNSAASTALPLTSTPADECFEVTEENLDDFVNVSVNPSGKSILRLHSVNARYVQHIVLEERITALCHSYIKEGVGVNVIATAIEGGIVRLWSSWNLCFITEIPTGISNIKSITYSTHQHLVVLTKDSYIQVWESEGLYGNPPKFPQIAFK